MADVMQFVPKHELDSRSNLEEFISLCKHKLTVFDSNLNWGGWQWKGVANFTKISVKSQGVKADDYLASEFMDFAKAYFRYQQGNKPTVAKNELRALRSIEKALIQVTAQALISDLSISVLDEAAVIAKAGYSDNAAYHAGREIERLAKFVSEKKLVPVNLELWRNPLSRANDRVNTGSKAKEVRDAKLPSSEVLNAMADIFASNPDSPKDVFTSSVFAMMMCAPSRISEVLSLPVDCEVEMPDKDGNLQYGWRFYSGKGFGGDIKWIPAEMVSVAKEAITRIRSLTESSRQEVLSKKCDVLVGEVRKIRLSSALFCFEKSATHSQGVGKGVFWIPSTNSFNFHLGPRIAKYHQSIFDKYGYKKEDGSSLKVTSHQLRHLLSTIAERGGLAQDEIAKWAGRADAKQNRVYNQMNEYEMVVKAEEIDPSKSLFGPIGEAKKYIPVSIQEFNVLEKGAAHVTEFGFCVHDYVISPCEKYRDCLNCSEQVCIKGEEEKLLRIKAQLVEVEAQFLAASGAVEQGFSGADRWYEYHEHTLTHLRQLVDILESSELPDGSQIKLQNDKSFSHINRVLKNKIEPEYKLANKAVKLLGGGLG